MKGIQEKACPSKTLSHRQAHREDRCPQQPLSTDGTHVALEERHHCHIWMHRHTEMHEERGLHEHTGMPGDTGMHEHMQEQMTLQRGLEGHAHLEDSRVCEASGEEVCLPQQAFHQRADVQGISLVVADQQQGAVPGDGPTPLLHPPILCCGQEHRALKRLQIVQCSAV